MSLFDNNYSTFTFAYRCNGKDVTVNLDKQDATVPQVLEEFMNFLKACGYCFDIDDRLDVVNDFRDREDMFDNTSVKQEAEAYRDTNDLKYPVTEETIKWIDASNGKEYSSHPGFNYKLEDY